MHGIYAASPARRQGAADLIESPQGGGTAALPNVAMQFEEGGSVRADCKLRSASRKWPDAVGRRLAQILADLCRIVQNLDLAL